MHIAVYEMKVKPGQQAEFESAWAEVTDAIREHRNSLGSRLHKTGDPLVYMAYAQWPDRATYDDAAGFERFSGAQQQARQRMRDALEDVNVVYRAEVCDDRLSRGP